MARADVAGSSPGPRLASTRGRHPPRGAPRRPQSGPARGRAPRRRAAARRRRRRLGQDARPHAPGRAPDPRARREAERDPRDHVHEQGGGRDARAARADARPHGARDLDPHLPRRLRPHPAPRGGAARLPRRTSRSTTRPTRCASSRRAWRSSARTRSASRRAGIHAQISNAKNQLVSPEEYASRVASFWDQTVAEVYELYQRRAASPRTPSTSTTCSC